MDDEDLIDRELKKMRKSGKKKKSKAFGKETNAYSCTTASTIHAQIPP